MSEQNNTPNDEEERVPNESMALREEIESFFDLRRNRRFVGDFRNEKPAITAVFPSYSRSASLTSSYPAKRL
jgi:hypothetical protein